jgi:Excreted virulence factor EspC, type VII ESX diderm
MPPDAPPPQPAGGQGFGVIADQLRALAGYFEDVEDTAGEYERRVTEIASITGEQTGRCCREAGDTLGRGLQTIKGKIERFGSAALDIRDALKDTARNYDDSDASGAGQLRTAGADL